jgi:hypothetical protein
MECSMAFRFKPLAFGFLLIVIAGSAMAARAPVSLARSDRASVLKDLLDCRSQSDPTLRLACYDKAATVMDQAEAKGDIVVVDREQAREVRKQAFGFTLPSMSLFSRGEKPEEVERINAKIAEAGRNRAGKWVITLEDGAVWAQTDTESPTRSPKIGMPVEIKTAAMGSYFLSVDGQRSFRARRDK